MCRKIELGNLFFIPQRDIQLFPNKGYKLSTRLRVNIIPFQAPVYIFIEYCIREFDTQRKEREREIRATEKWSTNDCILNTKRSSTGEKISQLERCNGCKMIKLSFSLSTTVTPRLNRDRRSRVSIRVTFPRCKISIGIRKQISSWSPFYHNLPPSVFLPTNKHISRILIHGYRTTILAVSIENI